MNNRNKRLIERCQHDLKGYAEARRKEVEKGRETPEFAALLVQKYGYGMWAVLNHLTETEDIPRIDGLLDVDGAVASINPEWKAFDNKRWSAINVGVELIND